MRRERGSVMLWVLGLSVLVLLFGGLAIDYWRGLALQRELAAVSDAAVVAAAAGIDETVYRATGEVVLDLARARRLGSEVIARSGASPDWWSIDLAPDGRSVEVRIERNLSLGLLGVFVDDHEPLRVGATAVAEPVLVR